MQPLPYETTPGASFSTASSASPNQLELQDPQMQKTSAMAFSHELSMEEEPPLALESRRSRMNNLADENAQLKLELDAARAGIEKIYWENQATLKDLADTTAELEVIKKEQSTRRTGFNHYEDNTSKLRRPSVSGTVDEEHEKGIMEMKNMMEYFRDNSERLSREMRAVRVENRLLEDRLSVKESEIEAAAAMIDSLRGQVEHLSVDE